MRQRQVLTRPAPRMDDMLETLNRALAAWTEPVYEGRCPAHLAPIARQVALRHGFNSQFVASKTGWSYMTLTVGAWTR